MRNARIAGALLLGIASLAGCSNESVFDLQVGTCVNTPTEATEVATLPTVNCSEEHDAEVFAVLDLTGIVSFDQVTVVNEANTMCIEEFESYVGVDYFDERAIDLGVRSITPSEESWAANDRGVTCLVVSFVGEKLTGSVKDSLG